MKLTVKIVAEFVQLEAERKELDRHANVIRNRTDAIRKAMAEALKANKDKPLKKGKHTISFIERSGRVSWKDEFVEVAGVEAAQKLMAESPPTKVLTVV